MTDQPEPAGNGQQPQVTFPATNQTITSHDGSAKQIIVHAWEHRDMDDATRVYYNVLFPILDDLEQDAADVTD